MKKRDLVIRSVTLTTAMLIGVCIGGTRMMEVRAAEVSAPAVVSETVTTTVGGSTYVGKGGVVYETGYLPSPDDYHEAPPKFENLDVEVMNKTVYARGKGCGVRAGFTDESQMAGWFNYRQEVKVIGKVVTTGTMSERRGRLPCGWEFYCIEFEGGKIGYARPGYFSDTDPGPMPEDHVEPAEPAEPAAPVDNNGGVKKITWEELNERQARTVRCVCSVCLFNPYPASR